MSEITQEYLRELFDYQDGDLIWKVNRGSNKLIGKIAGATRKDGYKFISIYKKQFLLHRAVWLWHYGEWPSAYIDHEDKNPSNCRIENLRIALPYQNNGNSKISKRNKTGIKGVTTKKGSDKFRAQISINNKSKHIGCYDTKEEAAQAYARAAIQYFGEFASL